MVSRSYLGKGEPVISGPDSTGAATVTIVKPLPAPALTVPTSVGHVADSAPTAEVVDPGRDTVLKVGSTVHPLIRATDDFAVQSATLLADGVPVGTASAAPYLLSWTPPPADAGKHVRLQALVTDSSGQETLTNPVVYAVTR